MNYAEFNRALRQVYSSDYRDFVAQYLLKAPAISGAADPFAIDLYRQYQHISTVTSGAEVISQTYVSRSDVERDAACSGSLAVIGQSGSGLSTLGQWMACSVRDVPGEGRPLYVFAPAPASGNSGDPASSILHPHSLALRIFRAFQARVIYNDSTLGEVESLLKGARDWLQRLSWLSNKWARAGERRGAQAQKLMDGIGDPPYSERPLSPEDELHAAVSLVLDAAALAPKSLPGSVRIIVDASNPMPTPDRDTLLNHLEALFDLCLEPDYSSCLTRVHVLLLVNATGRERLEQLRALREGRLPVSVMKPWTPAELEMLLRKRLELFRPGEYLAEYWPRDLPASCIKADGRDALLRIITEGGARVYELQKQDVDAPIHTLRIARCLLAALAGQWETVYPRPLSARSLEDLAHRYWED